MDKSMPGLKRAFDYVIVGAGSAGCTLANRLSEDPNATVLVLEAGGWDRHPFLKLPLGWGKVLLNRMYDWGYDSEPEGTMGDRRIEVARGKVVGGSSSINAMAYVRGNRADYDRWASYGLPAWSYENVLPYFRRQESWEGGASAYRGGDGPLATRKARYKDPLVDAYLGAVQKAGYALNDDYNGPKQDGFGRMQMTIRNGRRESAATAYLHPVLSRRNLTVTVKASVTRIAIEGTRATGVEYVKDGERNFVAAEREVILCGGTINSPQVLMLSGIGDPDELKAHGIAVKAALPSVGKGLQDHAAALLIYGRRGRKPVASQHARRPAGACARRGFHARNGLCDRAAGRHHRFCQKRSRRADPRHPASVRCRFACGKPLSCAVQTARSPTVSPAASCCCGRKAAARSRCARPTRFNIRLSGRAYCRRRLIGRGCAKA